MSRTQPIDSARRAILETLPEETSLFGGAPEPRFTHIPASHAKALHPDVQVVKGMRGSGKSFWWAALQKEAIRELVAERISSLRLFERVRIYVGFGETPAPDHYPGRDTLTHLLTTGHDPRLIWRTVLLRALEWPPLANASSWDDKVRQVQARAEEVERFLYAEDEALVQANRHIVVLFDALDRSASDWERMHRLIRGLLQTALDLRPYRRLRLKCFLRTDQLEERKVADFPDASKVLSSILELTWPSRELYAMFFQYLGNGKNPEFRRAVEERWGKPWRVVDEVWVVNDDLARDDNTQREVLHAITGRWMGRDYRRGFPYTWVPSHLADAAGRTSPRSFLAALRTAAEDSEDRYRRHKWPLHYESIKRGVQEASKIRQRELQEDYPWVHALMQPLSGTNVPCDFKEIEQAWEKSGALRRLGGPVSGEKRLLPPARLGDGPPGLREDLEDLGIFLRMADGRVNIPDVFRVAYGLGRKGGVRPIRRQEQT